MESSTEAQSEAQPEVQSSPANGSEIFQNISEYENTETIFTIK